jgi:thymidylate synthase ThyX
MERFYVGYNHKSIGDCGTTTVCIEGVSMLGAKVIQDWALYNGQESSTRYLDFSTQPMLDPVKTPESKAIQEAWRTFYLKARPTLCAHLKNLYPKQESEKEDVWERAINAKSFDILRGFLPAGSTTNVAWHTNLRQAEDHLALMAHHPLPEIWVVANETLHALSARYPHSFNWKRYPETEAYRSASVSNHAYLNPLSWPSTPELTSHLRSEDLKSYVQHLKTRPAKTEMLSIVREAGDLRAKFLLDFGSYRDLQRHRSLAMPMPLLTTKFGFNSWYLDQLPADLKNEALALLEKQSVAIANLPTTDAIRQYYIGMGYQVALQVTGGLPAWTYVLELRTSTTVHATLRSVMQSLSQLFITLLPDIALHPDLSLDDWDIRRGLQTITEKPNV